MRKLYISIQDAKPSAPVLCAVKRAAKAAAKAEGLPFRATLLITDEENIKRLNRQFRNIDAPTDVLSFPSGDEDYLGDIAISLPRAELQAEEFGQSLEREAAFLTVHAMLHLFGYDHVTEEGEQAMRERQRLIMGKLGL